MSLLFTPANLGKLPLQNHLVMCPLTRCRAIGNVPNALMAQYYGQRASVGLIVTEGTSPSPGGLGYARIPGIYSAEQTAAWAPIATAAHDQGAKIFMQIMHCGRVSHALNVPGGARILAPSAVAAKGDMWTDSQGMQPMPVPEAMSEADLNNTLADYVQAAKNAVAAGCDGIELDAANGYLLEQFIRPNSNQRTDAYGGSIEGRARFVIEVARACIAAIGAGKVGIRLSPYGVFNDMPLYPEMEADYTYLAAQMQALGLAYVHLVDHSAAGASVVPASIKATFRSLFKGTLILSGGYDAARAEADLQAGKADLIAVGKPILANPDLVARWKVGAALNAFDANTFYTGDAVGYTDYPLMA